MAKNYGAPVSGASGRRTNTGTQQRRQSGSQWRKPNGSPRETLFNGGTIADTAYQQYLSQFAQPQQSTSGGGGGGGGFGGGGGGGGGGSAITQAMIDAMAQALSVQNKPLTYQDLPAFRGQALGAFNAAPYNAQRQQVNQAVDADMANFATNQAATTQAVQGAYTNPYATAQVQSGPAAPVIGAGLMATAGGAASPAAAQQVNAENAQNQGTFQDLLNVLSAGQQASQGSRMQQVAMDANYGRQNLNAQALGLRGGIANQQAQAANQWSQQAAERNYQNSLMQQQWNRENVQGRQATTQANWQQGNANLTARLQPILDLIAQTGGTSGLNLAPLLAALRGAGR